MAAQCLLVASKYNEVQRLFPAEIVYQVKGWGEEEFEVLRQGQIEEYILNVLEFDMMFQTPIHLCQKLSKYILFLWYGLFSNHQCNGHSALIITLLCNE